MTDPKSKPKSVVAHFRMTEDDANAFVRVSRRFPGVSNATLTLRAFQLGIAALEREPGLFAVEPDSDRETTTEEKEDE